MKEEENEVKKHSENHLNEADCKSWSPEAVSHWIYTLSEKFHFLAEEFLSHQVTGKDLLCLDDESLEEMITNKFTRRIFVSRLDNLKILAEETATTAEKNVNSETPKKSPPPPGLPPFHPPRKKPKVTSTWTSKSYNRTRDRGISDSANIDLDLSLGRIDPEEYENQSKRLVRFVTGTQVNETTAQRADMYSAMMPSTANGSDVLSTQDSEKRYNQPIQFEQQVPDWSTLDPIKATKFTWDPNLSSWSESKTTVKIAKRPFSKGSLRLSYYMLDLSKKQSDSSSNSLSSISSLYNIGFDPLTSGTLKVAKTSIDPWEPTMTYFDDVHTQTMASKFAKEYSSYKFVPKKIAFLSSWVYRLDDRCTDDQQIFIGVEDYLIGKYEKHLDNHGGVLGERNTPDAFAHYTYVASERRLIVCDIQGVGDLYTDPQIHSLDAKGFGKGNLGVDGIVKFFTTHQCNAICQHFKFRRTYNPKLLIDGTAPAKRFMEQDTVSTIPTETRRIDLPDSVRKFEERRIARERGLVNYPHEKRSNYRGDLQTLLSNEEDEQSTGCCFCC